MNSSFLMVGVLLVYFVALLIISYITSKNADSDSFFSGNKRSPWYLVAFGMIGTSLSGVTFISVPGMVSGSGWHYFQLVLGFFLGYLVVAYVLLPLYYKYQLTSIYRYLEIRLGFRAYQWGAGYFILSRTLGATARLYLVINVLQLFIFNDIGIPFQVTTLVIMLMILAYTFKGGVKTIVWTDTLQTVFMLLALVVCVFAIQDAMQLDWAEMWSEMTKEGKTEVIGRNPLKNDYFWKYLLGGAFITITMTGLDQEMMQKNISVKTLKDAQKNMVSFSVILIAVNALFLFLGGALFLYAKQHGLSYAPDDLFPSIVQQHLPYGIFVIFIIGLISALFPSVDGAITALTSSFCLDILGFERGKKVQKSLEADEEGGILYLTEKQKVRIRQIVHVSFAILFTILVFIFKWVDDKSIINLIFRIAGYTYGPLLALFSFGILTKRRIGGYVVPIVCLLSPVLCYAIETLSPIFLNGYTFGNELLIVNGLITFLLLLVFSKKNNC